MDVASKLPYLALAYVVTGRKTYFNAAREWTLASCAYPHWGTGTRDGGDLAAGYMLLGVGVVYDWLYADLDAPARQIMRQTLIERSRIMYRQSSRMSWSERYLQNHLWVTMAGLGASAFAVLDDPEAAPEAAQWVNACLTKFRRTETLLGNDGASHEGVTYWSLGIDGLQRFWALAADLLGEQPSATWWSKTGYYRIYMSLPRNSWTPASKVIDFADGIGSDWVGPDYLLRRLAAMNQDGYLQGFGNDIAPVSTCNHFGACWLNPAWYDPSIIPKPIATLPAFHYFPDMGIVSARSDWSGNESLLTFLCGPTLGHHATDALDYDAGGEHVHPAANHFVLFGAGEFLLRDDGYRYKYTDLHNTLLIDGKGQIGEDGAAGGGVVYGHAIERGMWLHAEEQIKAKLHPRILKAQSTPAFDYIQSDATEAYPKSSGLKRFLRQMVFIKPDVLIVADDVVMEGAHTAELRFHPQFPAEPDQHGAFIAHGRKATLRIQPLTTGDVQIAAAYLPSKDFLTPAKVEGYDKLEDALKMFTVQLKSTQPNWRNVVVFSWAPANEAPERVSMEAGYVFHAGKRTLRLKWDGSLPE